MTPQKEHFFLLHIFFCFSFKNYRLTNAILISIFENAQKPLLTAKNSQNGVFDGQLLFVCVFKNTNQKNICVFIVYKAESKPKLEEQISWGVFFKNQKRTFSGVQKFHTKNINFWAPWNVLKRKTLTPKIWI